MLGWQLDMNESNMRKTKKKAWPLGSDEDTSGPRTIFPKRFAARPRQPMQKGPTLFFSTQMSQRFS